VLLYAERPVAEFVELARLDLVAHGLERLAEEL